MSIQADGMYGTKVKVTAVPIDDQSKNGLNFPLLPLELSIIIDSMGERIMAITEARIVRIQAIPVDILKYEIIRCTLVAMVVYWVRTPSMFGLPQPNAKAANSL